MAAQSSKAERSRTWAAVFYPDSAPSDWPGIISEWHIQAAVSPLHDADNNADGAEKKPHYHILMIFAGKKSFDQVSHMISPLNGARPVIIQSPQGYCRYLVHADNPEKAQYNRADIRLFGGFDLQKYFDTGADRGVIIREIQTFCRENGVTNFADLMDYALENQPTWYSALCTYCSALILRYLKSLEDRELGSVKRRLKTEKAIYEAELAELSKLREQAQKEGAWLTALIERKKKEAGIE